MHGRTLRGDLRHRRWGGRGVRGRVDALPGRLEDRRRGEVEEARDGGEQGGGGGGGGARSLEGEGLHGVQLGPLPGALGGQRLDFWVRRWVGRPSGGGTSWFGVFGGGGDF